jgi:rubredoxin
MLRLNPMVHELCSALRFVGLRDRLRCPACRAVGTYKPHGGRLDTARGDVRGVRRWMCKCCGLYYGPEGRLTVFPNSEAGYWDLPENATDTNRGETPRVMLRAVKLWPWHG